MTAVEKELKRIEKLPEAEVQLALAGLITEHFLKYNVDLVVVGGASVQYYTQAEYVTGDLDAILYGDTKEIVEEVMKTMGFKRTTNYRHFEHPGFPFVVEFPPSPIIVGSRSIRNVEQLAFGGYSVKVIRIEDIIMDRIIAGVEWRERASIDQAKLMWIKNKNRINKDYLIDFATKEGYLKTLEEVMKA